MQKVLNHIAAHEEQSVRELCDYLRFASVSAQPHHRADVYSCARWLANHCEQIGLTAEFVETPGHPIVLARAPHRPGRPHVLVYGHYDVQPAEPLELWTTPPFDPRRVGRSLFARGASDNKGQHFAHLKAVEAYLATGTELPVNLTFLIEGEEEVGCANLGPFLRARAAQLRADTVVVSDTGMPDKEHPALTYALRGIAAMEVKVHGPSRDLHSGIYGGSLENPAMALCQLLARLKDSKGRVAIPGFYRGVEKLSAYERKQLRRIPFDKDGYLEFLGVPRLHGERGFTPVEQRSARPTCEINGLTSGYQGEGSKTIIPAWASAKLTFRLVPGQQPDAILKLAARFLQRHCPKTVRLELQLGHGGEPYLVSPQGPRAQAALRALRTAFSREPVLMREGGSIPIVTEFRRVLGADTLLLGLGLPDDNVHSPNEKFDLDCFAAGMRMSALLWQELAQG